MRMSPIVPRPPLSVDVVVVGGGACACVEVSGAGWGSGANGVPCASARAGAASARSASSRVTRATTPGNLAIGEATLQSDRVAHGEALPVVVEVREDLAVLRELADAQRPLVQLGVGVVAAPPPRGPVEADER